jgi:threonine/homoserine/homoserine lactone efflux protein
MNGTECMDTHTLFLFSATVVPLVCTPGPDMLFIASQAISGGVRAGLRSALGVCLGYLVHSSLVTLGFAAVIAASPVLFEVIRWVGITYLVYLAYKLIRSALSAESIAVSRQNVKDEVRKGFLTSLLNPKGMMIYVAILPQFMDKQSSISMQAAILSAVFIFWCALVYSAVCIVLSVVGSKGGFSDKRRRLVNGGAGGLILLAAGFMTTA